MAVTCDDFVQAMQDASGVELTQFRRWYSQAGTPVVARRGVVRRRRVDLHARRRAAHAADARASRTSCRCTFRSRSAWSAPTAATSRCASTAKPRRSAPRACSTSARRGSRSASPASTAPPVPSLLRGFSAPVKVEYRLYRRRARLPRRARQRPGQSLGRRAAQLRQRDARARARSPRRAADRAAAIADAASSASCSPTARATRRCIALALTPPDPCVRRGAGAGHRRRWRGRRRARS